MHKNLYFLIILLLSCNTIFREYQNISDEYYKLAKLNEELGNNDVSIVLYEKSIEFNVNINNAASYNFILAYVNLKRYKEAELKLDSIMSTDSENILLLNLKGFLLLKQNNLNDSMIFYLKTLKLAPVNREALFNLFYIYHLKSDKKNAKKYISKYKELNYSVPNSAEEIVSAVLNT